ncbi:MAG TPA: LLM class flavin-dependent oxidoreductase, partial [Pseudomonadales bacterium]|nr:LLM class flavin-dependent oxidoreductase [Pseudomonadales bacterium]
VYLAAVGPRMLEVAGEVGDGLLVHPFATPHFIASEVLPAFERGIALAGAPRAARAVSCQVIVATGLDRKERERNLAQARGQVAFYASTPAYRPVLDAHGWGDLQPRLNLLSKQGKWAEMGEMLSDELVNEVVVHGSPEEVGERLRARCAGWADRVSPVIYAGDLELRARLVRAIKG